MKRYLTLLLLCPAAAFGWGDTGHRAVCEIAWVELEAPARAEVERLIGLDPQFETFAESCTWADTPERQREFDHFVNFPRDTTAVVTGGCPLAETCLLTAIPGDVAVFENPGSTDREKLVALKLLGHWLGDIHQPMHVTFADDRGANSIEAVVEAQGELVETNLHAVWDSWIIGERLGDDYAALAARLRSTVTNADRNLWRHDSAVEWANESFQIARSPASRYCFQQAGACWYAENNLLLNEGERRRRLTIDERYAATHIATIERRLTQAGIRLGALLNRALP